MAVSRELADELICDAYVAALRKLIGRDEPDSCIRLGHEWGRHEGAEDVLNFRNTPADDESELAVVAISRVYTRTCFYCHETERLS